MDMQQENTVLVRMLHNEEDTFDRRVLEKNDVLNSAVNGCFIEGRTGVINVHFEKAHFCAFYESLKAGEIVDLLNLPVGAVPVFLFYLESDMLVNAIKKFPCDQTYPYLDNILQHQPEFELPDISYNSSSFYPHIWNRYCSLTKSEMIHWNAKFSNNPDTVYQIKERIDEINPETYQYLMVMSISKRWYHLGFLLIKYGCFVDTKHFDRTYLSRKTTFSRSRSKYRWIRNTMHNRY
eukprot:TRINITY_DN2581_c0_g1_i1.p1 TRINITY_DN2581_c0_g1~~TRINITY_DN2581_c0_g1_i1.p1  ORF type:complete len:236 (-),score=41.23 TRINITY_DN2581_c0_g1_i1:422-1129(-)